MEQTGENNETGVENVTSPPPEVNNPNPTHLEEISHDEGSDGEEKMPEKPISKSGSSQHGPIQIGNSEKGGRATSFTVKPLNQSPSASANHAVMMMTGMSHFSPTNKMMQAKTQLKMMETQRHVVKNRIQKLSKEEELA